MESFIRIGFVGFSENFETYRKALSRFNEDTSFIGACFPGEAPENYTEKEFSEFDDLLAEVDAVFFFGDKVRKKLLTDAIKAVKHIFVDNYAALMNAEVSNLQELADEAGIIAQVSFPKTYFWGIQDLADEYPKIRNIFFYREYPYQQKKQGVDMLAEVLSAIKLIGEEVVRVNTSYLPLIAKRNEMQIINIEFATGATANITGVPVGFFDRHELRIIADRSLAYIDLRKREWHSLKPAKAITGNLIKGLAGLPEVGDIEQFELEDFIESIQEKAEPFVSFRDITSLHNCVKLLENE